MLVMLQPIQVPSFWETIKFAAVSSDNVKEKYWSNYCRNLLQDLLSGKKSVLIGYGEENKINFVLVFSINIELTADVKYLMLDNLYAFEKQKLADWKLIFKDVFAIAKKEGCDVVACNTTNDRIIEMAKSMGAELYTSTYYKYL